MTTLSWRDKINETTGYFVNFYSENKIYSIAYNILWKSKQCNYKHSKNWDISALQQVYQGLQTLCWALATSFLQGLVDWNVLLGRFSRVLFVDLSMWTDCLFPGDFCVSSLGRSWEGLALWGFRLVDFSSSGLGASSWASAWPRPLSRVLEVSPLPSGQQSLLESCANIQRSRPLKWSAINKYWLKFARQLWKPDW